jgi:hypothetical protein
MAWSAAIAAAIGAAGAIGSSAINASRSNGQQIVQGEIAQRGTGDALANKYQADLIQQLINQRSIAGQTDSQGSSLAYDPGTNTWRSTLGAVPQQVQDASDQAAISRNTTDMRQAQEANAQSAKRATLAQPLADAARRNLESFRPMGSDQLTGLLEQQATNASNATFRPLVADTLRSFARTGTSAGPVLGQIGRDASSNLRDSLIDAQLKGMTGVDQINNSRRSALEGSAANAHALATPQFGYTNSSVSPYSNAMATAATARANTATVAPAYGAAAVNSAAKGVQDAYANQGKNVPDPNFDKNQQIGALENLTKMTGKGGAITNLIDELSKPGSKKADPGDVWGEPAKPGSLEFTNDW